MNVQHLLADIWHWRLSVGLVYNLLEIVVEVVIYDSFVFSK